MDVSQFPLEVLEVVADELTAQDVSACSAVSSHWRDAFNLDLFWRKYCSRDILPYLLRERGLVAPHFKPPTNVDSLEPLCCWRVHVMRKAHLLRNWNKGRYHTERIKFQTTVVNCTLGLDTGGHHWLVVNLGDRTEIWDVQTTPNFHATVGNITGAPSYLEIIGDKLVIADFYYFVQVFHINLPTLGFAASSKFFYTDSETLYMDLTDNEEWNAVRERMRSALRKGHVLFSLDYFLIGYCSYAESPKEYFLHVWNTKTETKYSEETILSALHRRIKTFSCSIYVSSDSKAKQLLCSLYLLDRYVSKLVIYDIKYKNFTDFCITVSGKVDWCEISGGMVATSHLLHQLHIYSSHSGNLIHILDSNAKLVFGPHTELQYQIMGQYMVQPSRESVRVINIREPLDTLLLYFYSVYKVITIPPKFIAVSARPYVSSNKMILEVWNIVDKIRLFEHLIAESECPAFHMVHPLLTKTAVALGKTVKILSFW